MSDREKSVVEVAALDHVHLYVADPDAAADWYARVLGLRVLPSSRRLKGGKYMATQRGHYCATLFTGRPPSDGDHTTAFKPVSYTHLTLPTKIV